MKKLLLIISTISIALSLKAQVFDTVNVITPGTLSTLLTVDQKATISNLTVTGTINSSDFSTMKSMVKLNDLTLTNASVTDNKIPASAFYNDSILTTVHLPLSVTVIGSEAFYSCKSIKSITISPIVTTIGYDAFGKFNGNIFVDPQNTSFSSVDGVLFNKNKTKLIRCPVSKQEEYDIPTSVDSIGVFAFKYCDKLTNVFIPPSVKSIDEEAFSYCTGLTSVMIPPSVTYLFFGAFMNCSGVTSLSINSSEDYLRNGNFSGCSKLSSVYIPKPYSLIGEGAFAWCDNLQSVSIPVSVNELGPGAFSETDLKTIYCYNPIPPIPSTMISTNSTVFYNVNIQNCTLFVPAGKVQAYKSTDLWADFNIKEMPASVLKPNSKSTYTVSSQSTSIKIQPSHTPWTAFVNVPWLQMSQVSSNSNDSVTIKVKANNDTLSRIGMIVLTSNFNSDTILFTQCGRKTVFTIAAIGKKDSILVSPNSVCTISTNTSWLHINKTTGNANNYLVFTADSSDSISVHTAQIIITTNSVNDTITINQEASPVSVQVSTTNILFTDTVLSKQIIITSNSPWSASADVNWLHFTPATGTGNDTLVVTADSNTTGIVRTGTITIESTAIIPKKALTQQIISVTQDATITSAFELENNAIIMYPNPASKGIAVRIENEAIIQIYSTTGILLKDQQILKSEIISLEGIPSGMYMVKIKTNNGVQTKQLIVK